MTLLDDGAPYFLAITDPRKYLAHFSDIALVLAPQSHTLYLSVGPEFKNTTGEDRAARRFDNRHPAVPGVYRRGMLRCVLPV